MRPDERAEQRQRRGRLDGVAPTPTLRAELLLVRAWAEVGRSGRSAADDDARRARGTRRRSRPATRCGCITIENVRGFIALAEGRLDEAERALVASGEAAERAGRPDFAYGGWANAACVATAAHAHERALVHAERGAPLVTSLPVLEFQVCCLRAAALARLGRHDEARSASERQMELAAHLGSAELRAMADHDSGLIALQAGDYERRGDSAANALEQPPADPACGRPAAPCRGARALGRADDADAEIRAATLEPVRPADRPAVLVARMTFAQALSARARGRHDLADRRLREAEAHWRRLTPDACGDFLSSLVDLGRPPVAGVVDPLLELERVRESHAHVR